MNYEALILAVLISVSVPTSFDWVVYILSKPPASTFFSRKTHAFGLICLSAIVYYVLNNFSF